MKITTKKLLFLSIYNLSLHNYAINCNKALASFATIFSRGFCSQEKQQQQTTTMLLTIDGITFSLLVF